MPLPADSLRDLIDYADRNSFDDWPHETVIPGLSLVRSRRTTEFTCVRYEPIFCLVLQGAKQSFIGDKPLTFERGHALIVSIDLPTTARVVEASPQAPYLALALQLDTRLLRELVSEHPEPAATDPSASRSGMRVQSVTEPLTDVMLRLFRLNETPRDITALAPLLVREIHYRLLRGPDGGLLRNLVQPDTHTARLSRAIGRIRRDYTATLTVQELAREAGMSASAFHEHFRALTGTSPLQFQKSMRLLEAQRRLLDGEGSVSAVAFAVGYESPTQFSREYSRKFGHPPRADRAA
jgi:AraC-like DNA-binding protein